MRAELRIFAQYIFPACIMPFPGACNTIECGGKKIRQGGEALEEAAEEAGEELSDG